MEDRSITEMIEREFRKKHGLVCPKTKEPYEIIQSPEYLMKNEVYCSECRLPYDIKRRKFLSEIS